MSYRRSSSRPIPSQRVFYYKSPIFTGSRSELVDPVLVGLVVLGPALHLNVLDVLSLVESTAQPRLPRHVVRSVNAFAILSRLLRPFLHTTANTTIRYLIGPILWSHSVPLCHALSLLSLWTSIVATVARRQRNSYSCLRLILVGSSIGLNAK